jgi:peptidyl-prolyl cis-trans isomerase C
MNTSTSVLPQVNGVVLAYPQRRADDRTLRQRACTELLRQAAIRPACWLPTTRCPLGGAITEAASTAIEALLDRELHLPEPSEEACRRHHAAQPARYAVGERAQAAPRAVCRDAGRGCERAAPRAEACLLDLRCDSPGATALPRGGSTSNCPSGAEGGALGWLTAEDCAPEFARESGASPRSACCRAWCTAASACTWWKCWRASPALDQPRSRPCARPWRRRCASRPLPPRCGSTCNLLAGSATVMGVDLEAAESPLVQ